MLMKKLSNLVGTEEENRLFQINKKPENPGLQKREKARRKSILDFMVDL